MLATGLSYIDIIGLKYASSSSVLSHSFDHKGVLNLVRGHFCMWRLEVDVRFLTQSLSTSAGTLTEPKAFGLG